MTSCVPLIGMVIDALIVTPNYCTRISEHCGWKELAGKVSYADNLLFFLPDGIMTGRVCFGRRRLVSYEAIRQK